MTGFTTRLAVCASMLLTGSAALAVPSIAPSANDTVFPVANNDLINGVAGVVTGTPLPGVEGTSTNVNVLTNGQFGAGDTIDGSQNVAIQAGTVITYNLDTVAFSMGYKITGVNTFTGWQDNGRINQNYTLLYSTVAAPGVFIPITTVAFDPVDGANGTPNSTQVLITDTTGTLATQVAAIRFQFGTQQNGHVGFRELDVIGVGIAVPEPATLAMLSVGSLALIARRRRIA